MSKYLEVNKIKEIMRPYYYSIKDLFDFKGNALIRNNIYLENSFYTDFRASFNRHIDIRFSV